MTMKILGGRRWKRRWWRRCSTSGRSVAQRGGGGGCGGARKHSEGSRGRRWLRWCSSVAAAPLGSERERETEEGECSGGSEGRSGRRVASSGALLGRPRRKQEVAEAASASATPRLWSSSWQRRKRTKEEEVGWAGHLGRQVSPGEIPSLSLLSVLYFCFLFCSVLF